MEFGMMGVAAVTVICYLVGLAVKASPWNNDKYIPVLCGAAGGVLGLIGLYTGLPDIPAQDPVTALAVGIVSGLAATGADQAAKQLHK